MSDRLIPADRKGQDKPPPGGYMTDLLFFILISPALSPRIGDVFKS